VQATNRVALKSERRLCDWGTVTSGSCVAGTFRKSDHVAHPQGADRTVMPSCIHFTPWTVIRKRPSASCSPPGSCIQAVRPDPRDASGISSSSTRSVGPRMNTSHIMSGCCWLPLMKPITWRPVAS
jgi:hypothetical protein